jgi:quercetin dioxygenase-like cupin family protein
VSVSDVGNETGAGSLVVPCDDLDPAVEACQALGFRLDAIGPADEPTWAEVSMPGLRLRLDAGLDTGRVGPRLRLPAPADGPGGVEVDPELVRRLGIAVETGPPAAEVGRPQVPPTVPSLVVSHEADGTWKGGRAGMRYRDLVPDRWGGAYIASHIHVPEGGPVPDYVHHHDVVHQLIFCHRGWVRVVYQDQGPPFVLEPGDCVLQPPGIRHQVLETSDDLYVVEVGCPAVHRTSVDHELDLPNRALEPDRRYQGQQFVRHVSARAPWVDAGTGSPLRLQDTGLAAATDGLVSAHLLRCDQNGGEWDLTHDDDLRLVFVVSGRGTLTGPAGDRVDDLVEGSSAAIPPGAPHRLTGIEGGTILFEVRSPQPLRGMAAIQPSPSSVDPAGRYSAPTKPS